MAQMILTLNEDDRRDAGILMCIRGWLAHTVENQRDNAFEDLKAIIDHANPGDRMIATEYGIMDEARRVVRRTRMLELLRNAVITESGGAGEDDDDDSMPCRVCGELIWAGCERSICFTCLQKELDGDSR